MLKSPQERSIDVLLVEDNPGDVRFMREAFAEASIPVGLQVAPRGEEALERILRADDDGESRPDLVLLDLNLPGMDGFEILERLSADPELKRIPVVILTSSVADEDVVRGYSEGANAYVTKPVDASEFMDLVRTIGEFWWQTAELPDQ